MQESLDRQAHPVQLGLQDRLARLVRVLLVLRDRAALADLQAQVVLPERE